MISRQSIEDVKQQARLVDAIGETVQLTRRGGNYVGLCPFHSEKTPSFNVNDTDNFYHCFGCGESGNVISWYMKTQGLAFPEALEYIAERFGITLKREGKQNKIAGPDKKEIYAVNMAAYKFFRAQLDRSPKQVLDYLNARGLTPEVCDYFGIGFSGIEWRSLADALIKRGFKEELLFSAALIKRSKTGEIYDTFRSRLIYPIWVDGRRIAGFGGRVIPGLDEQDSKTAPKYLNSPETAVYLKSTIFYGLPQALESIRATKDAFIVEGYMDVIALHSVGVNNAIATCGTALTVEHVKRLKSLARRVALLFDGDNAGRQAAAKSFKTFINSGIDVSALFLPQNEDPDTVARKYKLETAEYLNKLPVKSLMSCYAEFLLGQHAIESFSDMGAALKGRLSAELANIIQLVVNRVEQDEMIKEAAFLLQIDKQELGRLVDSTQNKSSQNIVKNINQAAPLVSTDNISEHESEAITKPLALNELRKIERDLLSCIMVLKNELPQIVLNDPLLIQELNPLIIQFADGLKEIVQSGNSEQAEKKESIKAMLISLGPDWVQHWKSAYLMSANEQVDMKKLYSECCMAFRKKKIEQAVSIAQQQIDATRDEDLRAVLIAQKIELIKQSKAVLACS